MIVKPYKRFHKRKRICFVTPDGEYVDETGEYIDCRDLGTDWRCFTSWETARTLTMDGRGEALLWNGEHIRWRPYQHPTEDVWRKRPYDAYVLRIPMYPQPEHNLREICRWRDWLHSYRAIPSTMGGSSMSLLRARLRAPLYCSTNWNVDAIKQSAGGRITNGPNGPGEYTGSITHWDLPAAYATEIGTLRYGGRWFECAPNRPHLDRMHNKRVPIFVRARVYVPKRLDYGPLPTRPRHALHPFKALLLQYSGKRYPTGKTVQGIWTYEEILAAEKAGCSIRIIESWYHSSPRESPFRFWWAAVQDGRDMQGMAGALAKVTGNALWGMFAMDPTLRGSSSIVYMPRNGKKLRTRKPKPRPVQLPAVDLAEIVAGRVRARLFSAMLRCGEELLCAHTDGLWAQGKHDLGGDWRAKDRATEMQLIDPQRHRTLSGGKASVIYSGVPYERAAETFQEKWEQFRVDNCNSCSA